MVNIILKETIHRNEEKGITLKKYCESSLLCISLKEHKHTHLLYALQIQYNIIRFIMEIYIFDSVLLLIHVSLHFFVLFER